MGSRRRGLGSRTELHLGNSSAAVLIDPTHCECSADRYESEEDNVGREPHCTERVRMRLGIGMERKGELRGESARERAGKTSHMKIGQKFMMPAKKHVAK